MANDDYTPDLRWFWAIFQDHHELGSPTLACSIKTDWFYTLDEAKEHMRDFDPETHRVHGVLRDANE